MPLLRFVLLSCGLILGLHSASQAVRIYPDEIDHSGYDELLRTYVSPDGLVNYAGLRAEALPALDSYLKRLADADLKDMSHEQRLAFWINAYNARVIREVADRPKLKKITATQDFFDTAFPIAKKHYSLNDILNGILRETPPDTGNDRFRNVSLEIFDPRIHFALNRGTRGDAPLKNFAYTSVNLEDILRKNAADFANSPRAVRIQDGRLVISNVMNEFAEDFESGGGPEAYLSQLLEPSRREDAAEIKRRLITDYRKADFEYDWTVNGM